MISIYEYLLSKTKKKLTITANNETLYDIVQEETDKLGPECDLNHIDVSNCTTLMHNNRPFWGAVQNFNCDISRWDVSHIENFDYLFLNARSFNSNLSGWDMHNAKSAVSMFYNCEVFEGIGLENWDVSKLKNAERMFYNCLNLNSDISRWKTSSLENAERMFLDAKNFDCDLSGWPVNNVNNYLCVFTHTNMSKNHYPKFRQLFEKLDDKSTTIFNILGKNIHDILYSVRQNRNGTLEIIVNHSLNSSGYVIKFTIYYDGDHVRIIRKQNFNNAGWGMTSILKEQDMTIEECGELLKKYIEKRL